MSKLTHLNEDGQVHMVDVGGKEETDRRAVAAGKISMSPMAFQQLANKEVAKGSVLSVARIAAIQATKKTSDLVPLCHPLPLSKVNVEFELDEKESAVEVQVEVKTRGVTGVEMEAIMGVSVALITVYDMLKAVDKGMILSEIRLLEKQGGKSGSYKR